MVKRIVDEFFNTPMTAVTKAGGHVAHQAARASTLAWYPAGVPYLTPPLSVRVCTYSAPQKYDFPWIDLHAGINRGSFVDPRDCPICLEPLQISNADSLPTCTLKKCEHGFHFECLKKAISYHQTTCPICSLRFMKPRGFSPSGSMSIVKYDDIRCDGHPTIAITYKLQAGIQKGYHPNPGSTYGAIQREAFLPATQVGTELLCRLITVFQRGLTFRVDTSRSKEETACITWATIPHKTSSNSGPHGFPDPTYFVNVNLELDSLGIPEAHRIRNKLGT